ncbi:YbdD/YjiX family protein [Nocardia terpenica]|uniref:YbdD/YjiX family protein n=1 Tax=Nocardia terpenica TaxID=455432 RepID=UPI001892E9AF|nr:YbdD/YjiX family protein [Nocardia terpenica]MBF6104038.1 YbdD/YjiX family protein [Nocardia terpenica]MBF6111588.1 YbdD/YjiX family protein [Nocardia terpenica]MBF6118259.1 YbdD/YjiX family protein [Nocardia terpenica]MBF6156116.1 YbdD/YjiX family protein [Nocardia terpenica]
MGRAGEGGQGKGARGRTRPQHGVKAALRAARALIWYVNSVLGGQDYARYVEHLRRNHPDHPIPTEREYWRERHAAADRNPANRCC